MQLGTRRLAGLLIAFGATVAAAFAVGHFAANPPQDFAWDSAVRTGTAMGTTLLALFTGYLAFVTRADLQLTASLAREAYRPVVVADGTRTFTYEPETGGSTLLSGFVTWVVALP